MTPGLDDFGAPTLDADQDDEDVYVQTIEQSVLAAVNARTSAALGNWRMPEKGLDLKGRNLKFGEVNF